ncbi:MAG: S-methyl-5'-thioadenosine phosphorylase [Pseudanabaenaceae cyanobacterium SKYGB_i_bin29]|nr:S-methyl-5'-thioadenosine phosphorylase [Pseudanabaenaceae cyanobacterium SKYG29]MDW8420607.1 S-methyl-5'-thioadenosine phosphorylase [Pseudanabaenaceae cyanobacterium SKYGB_i_bin29]
MTYTIGIIGGSGLYQMPDLELQEEISVVTPFGATSDTLLGGSLGGAKVVFLPRHGRTHHLLPQEVPYRANIYALKELGVKYILSASAVGSLQAEICPLDLVVPHQFIDRTYKRADTFFGEGIVAHVSFSQPVCPYLAEILATAATAVGANVHRGGVYLCIEGPAFSSQAESHLYRQWGASVIGMTNVTEAKLAREAEIAYATLALVTDYDCWHPDHAAVTVEMVVANLQQNAETARQVIRQAVAMITANPPVSPAHSALKQAILTDLRQVPPERLQALAPILRPYLPGIG